MFDKYNHGCFRDWLFLMYSTLPLRWQNLVSQKREMFRRTQKIFFISTRLIFLIHLVEHLFNMACYILSVQTLTYELQQNFKRNFQKKITIHRPTVVFSATRYYITSYAKWWTKRFLVSAIQVLHCSNNKIVINIFVFIRHIGKCVSLMELLLWNAAPFAPFLQL